MKKSSQWVLGSSLVMFVAAGTVKFWPEDRFFPTAPSVSAQTPRQAAADILPVARAFAPGWADGPAGSASPPRTLSGDYVPNAADAPASPVMTGQRPNFAEAGNSHDGGENKGRTPVSLTAQNMPVGEILSRLFHQAGVSFALTAPWNEPMTLTIMDAPLEQAITQTLQMTAHPHLICRLENGVYTVGPEARRLPPPRPQIQSSAPYP